MFWIGQLFGITALTVLCFSFQKNEKNKLLKYQTISSILFALQYLFLNAITGCLINITCAIRNIIFNKYKNKKIPLIWLLAIITIMIGFTIFSYTGPISILPGIACILYSISIWQNNLKITRVVEVISCSLYIIYNIQVQAYAGLVSTIIELISATIAIYKYDIKNREKN